MIAARSVASQLLEAAEDVDPRSVVTRYTGTDTRFPGYSVEVYGNHWCVYTETYSRRERIGEVYSCQVDDDQLPHMSAATLAAIAAKPWIALGWRNEDAASCASFDEAVRAVITMNDRYHEHKPKVAESADDVDDPAGMVKHYATPTELVVKNQNGRAFRVLLSLESPRAADVGLAVGLPLVLPWVTSTRALADGLAQPVITFYDLDASTEKFSHGQKVTSYCASSLARHTNSLELYSDVPVWTVDAAAMRQVSNWITDEIETKRGYVLKDDLITGGVYVRPTRTEALDPDAPELMLKPNVYKKQPEAELLASSLRVMLRPYYDEVTVQHEPHALNSVLSDPRMRFTVWTIHCKRLTPLELPPTATNTQWRAQAKDWFLSWAREHQLMLGYYAQHGRLRVDPMFTFETASLKIHESTPEADPGPEFYVSNMAQNAEWEKDLHAALWEFHPNGVSYRLAAIPPKVVVLAETMFEPTSVDFPARLENFVTSWLKSRHVVEVRTVKSQYVFQQGRPKDYPLWTVLVSVNADGPAAVPAVSPAPVVR